MKWRSSSRWLLESLMRDSSEVSMRDRLLELMHRRAFLSAAMFQIVSVGLCIALAKLPGPYPKWLELNDPSQALAVAWQVQAAFASIAFAGLALVIQVASDFVVTAKSLREVLFRQTWYLPALGLAVTGSLGLGFVAIWFPSNPGLLYEFVSVLGLTIWAVLFAYKRAADVYSVPGKALRVGQDALVDAARRSMSSQRRLSTAQAQIDVALPPAWTVAANQTAADVLTVERSGVLDDVDLPLLMDLAKEVSSEIAFASGPVTGDTDLSEGTGEIPRLHMAVRLRSRVTAGQAVVRMTAPNAYLGNRDVLAGRLARAFRWTDGE